MSESVEGYMDRRASEWKRLSERDILTDSLDRSIVSDGVT